ncbi:MAG: hypothetical protein ACRD16_04750 [Thermoanaerobaculia bacterium]
MRSGPLSAAILLLLAGGSTFAGAQSLVVVGKPLAVVRPVEGRVVSVAGDVDLRAPVRGDVVAWGGTVRIGAGAAVGGDLIAFGSEIVGDQTVVEGRILTPGSLAALYLAEARRGPLAAVPGTTLAAALGLRLLVLAIWALLSSAVLRLWGGAVSRGALCFEENPAAAALAGLAGIVFLLLSAVTSISAFPAAFRLPCAALILTTAAALKVFGMTSLFLFLGQRILGRFSPGQRPAALAAGLAVAGLASLVPVAGPLLWSAASVVAVGAAVFTRFGAPRFRVALA